MNDKGICFENLLRKSQKAKAEVNDISVVKGEMNVVIPNLDFVFPTVFSSLLLVS